VTGEPPDVDQALTLTLTQEQVTDLLSRATRELGAAKLLSTMDADEATRELLRGLMADDCYSRSTLRALLVLAAFPADGSARELTHIARQLGLSPSTTHRYIATWLATGLLTQESRSRKYSRLLPRLPGVHDG